MRYYIDTCVWRDHKEERGSLGKDATHCIVELMRTQATIVAPELLFRELIGAYGAQEIREMFAPLEALSMLEKAPMPDITKAKEICAEKNIPLSDTIHAIIAHNADATLITQDKHFRKLKDVVSIKRPGDIAKDSNNT